ncbi:MAG: carbamoyltransferase HypF, partial [Schwartzia sp.]|nr:carbamoyltransferase HypF [Schwartzia sp. (in: firmicutes)]
TFYPSAHIGDMGDSRSIECLRETESRMASLLSIKPCVVAYDPHPAYQTAAFAKSLGLPLIPVQHHHAHIVSCMAENGWKTPVIGVAFDGTGYGTDGTVWGGEILLADCGSFTRIGSVEPFAQAGGERAAREGWRIGVGLLHDGDEDAKETALRLGLGSEDEIEAQLFLLENGINAVVSTSAGRLFDAVSAALGICCVSTFEGEAAMKLQYAAEEAEAESLPFGLAPFGRAGDGRLLLPTKALFSELVRRKLSGAPVPVLAYAFHALLAEMIASACRMIRETTGISDVALSGGVFQNTLLLRLSERDLRREGFHVLRHRLIPPNDGGLSLGQTVCAMTGLADNDKAEAWDGRS